MKVVSEADAIRSILGSNRFALYLGAGASVDAGVPTAQLICDRIRDDLLDREPTVDRDDPVAVERWANEVLHWSDADRRYVTCIRRAYPNLAQRLEYFRRDILLGVRPSFSHHAAALLVSRGFVRPTVLTTNFDHLLESAFAQRGVDCQPIRSREESEFWDDRSDRFFIAKLHGDIDTLNILNTREETIAISHEMQEIVASVTRNAGLVVLGTGGNEKSVARLFDTIGRSDPAPNNLLSFGLLWGVYMGATRPKDIRPEEIRRQVELRVRETQISQDIVDVIDDATNELFCFFPVWGIDEFMLALVKSTADKILIGEATQQLDHEMRLRDVFSRRAGLSDDAIARHLARLRSERQALVSKPAARQQVDLFRSVTLENGRCRLRFLYGDITSRSLMSDAEFEGVRRAVVSPEDTFVSAGGGVAYQLLEKAGPSTILNELSKFAPIPHCSVAVTSAGALPIHYILHAAALEIGSGAEYLVSKEDVAETMQAILDKASALDIGVILTPLPGAGVGDLNPRRSLEGLLLGLLRWSESATATGADALTVAIVIYQEGKLPRRDVDDAIADVLGDRVVATHTQTTITSDL